MSYSASLPCSANTRIKHRETQINEKGRSYLPFLFQNLFSDLIRSGKLVLELPTCSIDVASP